MQTIDFNHLKIQANDKILDIGCGEGRHSIGAYWHGYTTCIGVDINHDDIKTAVKKSASFITNTDKHRLLTYTTTNAKKLPFNNNTFDTVICSEVLEHIHDYEEVLKEIQRVLKPKGQLAISVPRYWPEKICWLLSSAYHNVKGGHIRIFKSKALKQTLRQMDFSLTKRHWAHALHVPYWWLRCLFWNRQESSKSIELYHRFLVWDMLKKPALTVWLEKLLNPFMGKSIVLYFNNNK